jgi:nitrogen fixation protein NifB
MSPQTASARAVSEIKSDSRIRIVAISGPGEPLVNPETFETIQLIKDNIDEIHVCLSTNGTLLEENVPWLVRMGFKTLTVSMSAAEPGTAARIYEWARIRGETLKGQIMGSKVVDAQIRGITKAAREGITVKVNSILIPALNHDDMVPLASMIARAGATLQNIIPLVPSDKLASMKPPSIDQLETLRSQAAEHIEQFRHCKQCRSDVVGFPGCDVVL